ncbi:MAG: 50S ribosomal protein L22 [Clostridia bacterium]
MATRQKQKTEARRQNADKRPKAHLRYVRIATRKAQAVVNLIRGKSVKEAEAILTFTQRGATEPIAKLLKSAVANAENNLGLDKEMLYVAEVFANQGPTLKRFRPRAQGRASSIRKRTSHITIILDQAK